MSAPRTSNTADLPATALLAAYRTGELSPVEATRDALERIEKLDHAVNAYCLVDAERAMAMAHESQERWRREEPCGALDGVPTSIKDILLTIDWPTRRGSRTTSAEGPHQVDGPPVARVREHGAVLLGKTTTPELAWKGVTDSPLTGVTGNPWNPALTAGGSSGGSAAAVGLGMGALSLGTDGGGSVRIPAAFTGTVAHKPTYGRVAHHPGSPFGTLAHVGPMTRTVADAALLLDVISHSDVRDPWALPALLAPARTCTDALGDGVAGLRVAVSPTLGYARVDPEVAAAFAAAADVFATLGATVEYADPGFADPVEPFEVLWYAGAAKSIESLDAAARAEMDPALVQIAERGAGISALDYLSAMAVRNDLGTLVGEFHLTYDLLLTPTLPIAAFPAGREVPDGWPAPRWTSWTPFTYPFNMTQQPAVSVPCGFTAAGLPVGLQIVGPRHTDARVLAAAHAYEQATDHHTRRPPLLA
ncbi:amidase [Pseudonocardia asaccharolytica]|uniref:Amidase n=1 Tax=Pseudonocardia asaccharolytica DSM 44247 = NBRC 16224 TaxID=1123024 RepID=A0A511D1B9_9PSEU|nr:amidase [Pseudonocardia asaccharolytica]GEL18590.1 amidase [Pseudonocardia asaccharolytica DSM 44247 = NBRC 16224]